MSRFFSAHTSNRHVSETIAVTQWLRVRNGSGRKGNSKCKSGSRRKRRTHRGHKKKGSKGGKSGSKKGQYYGYCDNYRKALLKGTATPNGFKKSGGKRKHNSKSKRKFGSKSMKYWSEYQRELNIYKTKQKKRKAENEIQKLADCDQLKESDCSIQALSSRTVIKTSKSPKKKRKVRKYTDEELWDFVSGQTI